MEKDFKTIIDDYIKEQEEKINQKRKDAMLLIFKKFVEEELGYKIYVKETVGRRKATLYFKDVCDDRWDYEYDLDTCELLDEYVERKKKEYYKNFE